MKAMSLLKLLFGSAAQPQRVLMFMAVLLAPVAARGEYLLAPGDVLEIQAVGIPDLRHRVMIDLNGQASFPLIGDVKAAGLSVAELRKQVKLILSTKAFRLRVRRARRKRTKKPRTLASPVCAHCIR